MDLKECALVICGPFNENILKMIKKYKDIFNEIIVSSYIVEDSFIKFISDLPNIKFIKNVSFEIKKGGKNIIIVKIYIFNVVLHTLA